MSKRSVKRIDLKHKHGTSRGKSKWEEMWIQFFDDADKSHATSRILFRGKHKLDNGPLVYSVHLHYEGKYIIRQKKLTQVSGTMLNTEFDKIVAGYEELGFTAGKLKKSSEHLGYGDVETVRTVTLLLNEATEMELELPDSFLSWAHASANALKDESDET